MLRGSHRLTQQKGHRVQTGPASEPISLSEVRALLRNPPTTDNDFITTCITQARLIFEAVTGIACIDQTWKLTLDHWPNYNQVWAPGYHNTAVTEIYDYGSHKTAVKLPRRPLQSVDSVSVYDSGDNETVVSVSDVFFVDTASLPGRLCLRFGQTWPVVLRRYNGIEITYTAGFGSSADDVPESIKRAIQQVAAFLYMHRGEGCDPADAVVRSGALTLAAEYTDVRL